MYILFYFIVFTVLSLHIMVHVYICYICIKRLIILCSSTRLDHINNCLCFQVHMRNLELLVNLLGKYKLQLLPDCDRKSCHYIAAKSEAFSAKLG